MSQRPFNVPQGWGSISNVPNSNSAQQSIPPHATPTSSASTTTTSSYAPPNNMMPIMPMPITTTSASSYSSYGGGGDNQHQHQHQQQQNHQFGVMQNNNNTDSAQQQQPQQQNDASISRRPHFQSDILINSEYYLEKLHTADFQRPIAYPSALHVKPPIIAPCLKRDSNSRWSDAKYCNPKVPSYVPPEMLLWAEGKPLQMFLSKARLEDMKRLHSGGNSGVFFQKRGGELPENFTGWPRRALADSIGERLEQFENDRHMINELLAARETTTMTNSAAVQRKRAKFGGNSNLEYTRDGKIVHRIFFTRQQMEMRRYAAILGSQGSTHRLLEKETGCKISLGGRGITDLKTLRKSTDIEDAKKVMNMDPHCMLTAPTELHLQRAVEKVEFLMSDDPEAEELREKLKMKVDRDRGLKTIPNQSTTTTTVKPQQTNNNNGGMVVNDDDEVGELAGEGTADDTDAQADAFLSSL